MIMELIQGGLAIAGAATQIAGGFAQTAALRRQARLRVQQLQTNAELTGMRSAFEQSRVEDQVDATVARQANYFASGNIDASTGSPAILAAQAEAMGMQDQMLIAAKGQQERADTFGQISATWAKVGDAERANGLNMASTFLNTMGKLAGIAAGPAKQAGSWGNAFSVGDSATSGIGAPMNIKPWGLS